MRDSVRFAESCCLLMNNFRTRFFHMLVYSFETYIKRVVSPFQTFILIDIDISERVSVQFEFQIIEMILLFKCPHYTVFGLIRALATENFSPLKTNKHTHTRTQYPISRISLT